MLMCDMSEMIVAHPNRKIHIDLKANLPPHVPEKQSKTLFYIIIVFIKVFFIVHW